MPTIQGAWTPSQSANQRMRLVLTYDVTTTATTATVTGSVHVEAGYSFNDNSNKFGWSGSLLGAGSANNRPINVASGGSQQIHTFTKTVTRTSSAQGVTVAFNLSGIDYVGSSRVATVSATVSIPSTGATLQPPSSVTLTRNSDTSGTATWPAVSGAALYGVGRSINGAAYTWVGWASTTSQLLLTTGIDQSLSASVFTRNDAGQDSAPRFSNTIYTTPSAATGVAFRQTGNGAGIVTWAINARHVGAQRLQYSRDGGGWINWTGSTVTRATNEVQATGLAVGSSYRWQVVTDTPAPVVSATSAASAAVVIVAKPAAASAVTATRNSDWSWTVSWTSASSPTAWRVTRSINGGAWTNVATGLAGSARSREITGTAGDQSVRFGVVPSNVAGDGTATFSPTYYTTPAAATGVTATRSGTDTIVTWTVRAKHGASQDLQASSRPPGGTWGAFANVAGHTGLPASTNQRTVSGLDTSLEWRFRVVTRTTPPALSATSPVSNAVVLLQAPHAPTMLGPSGIQPEGPQTIVWRHNPADSTAQSAYELRHRLDGAAWTTLSGTTASSRTVAMPPGLVEAQVRTKGQHADWSPWSAVQAHTVAALPAVTITAPQGEIVTNRPLVEWLFSDPQGAEQTAWRAELWLGSTRLETRTGSTQRSTRFSTQLDNETDYRVVVSATAATGLASPPVEVTVTTAFLEPLPPMLDAEWAADLGVVQLSATTLTPTPGFDDAVDSRIERSIDGELWEIVAQGMGTDPSVDDPMTPLNAWVLYRAIAITALGVEAASQPVGVQTTSQDVWLRSRDGAMARVQLDLELDARYGHASVVEDYGRAKPVAHYGRARPVEVGVSGSLVDGYGLETRWPRFLGGQVWYRDPAGHAFWAHLSGGMGVARPWSRLGRISFTAEEVEAPRG